MHLLLIWCTYDGIGEKTVEEETSVGLMNGVEDIDEISVVSDPDPDWDAPIPITAVEVGLTGAKVIVSELDIVNDGEGRDRPVEWCVGKDVALVEVDDLRLVKPREVTIGEVEDGKVADVINVSVGVVKGKGVWGIQVENKEGEGVEMVKVDTSCAELGAEVASWVDDEIGEVILAEGVTEGHRGIRVVPSADDTPKEKSK